MAYRLQLVNTGPKVIKLPRSIDALVRDKALCRRIFNTAKRFGHLVLRIPGMNLEARREYIDMLERYFGQDPSILKLDIRPRKMRQGGLMEKNLEGFGNLYDAERADIVNPHHKPFPSQGNCKHYRFFHGINPCPSDTEFPHRYLEPFNPVGFPRWCERMKAMGEERMLVARLVFRAVEVALGLPEGTILQMANGAPHIGSPTAHNLEGATYGTVIADFHDDFNPATIHGPSRYRCLIAWDADLQPFLVEVPEGCVLVQFGLQMQWLTGGQLGKNGRMHQVVVVDETLEDMERAREEGRSLVRVGDVFFVQFHPDLSMRVPPKLLEADNTLIQLYPPTLVGEHSDNRIRDIGLAAQQAA